MTAPPADSRGRDRRVQELFEAALDLDEPARSAFLRSACGSDAGLRGEVQGLMGALGQADTGRLLPPLASLSAAVPVAVSSDASETDGGMKPGTVIAGTYRVIGPIRRGGMGEVHEVAHLRLPARYAIKRLLGSLPAGTPALARFEREARITSSLRHPNIVHVVDYDRLPDGAPYLVMELMEGEDLATRLRRGPWLGLPAIRDIVGQVASALAAAHSRGIIHRDLKPQNIFLVPLLGQEGFVAKVLDFGISKLRAATQELTRDAALVGTPAYMAPEQAQGHNHLIDPGTDQFALAAIAHEMIEEQPPFQAADAHAVLYRIIHEEAPPVANPRLPPDALPALREVLARALRKPGGQRFASILAFAEAFTAATRGERPGTRREPDGGPVGSGRRGRPMLVGGLEGSPRQSILRRARVGALMAGGLLAAAGALASWRAVGSSPPSGQVATSTGAVDGRPGVPSRGDLLSVRYDIEGSWAADALRRPQCFRTGTAVSCVMLNEGFSHRFQLRYVAPTRLEGTVTRRDRTNACSTELGIRITMDSVDSFTLGWQALDSNCDLAVGQGGRDPVYGRLL